MADKISKGKVGIKDLAVTKDTAVLEEQVAVAGPRPDQGAIDAFDGPRPDQIGIKEGIVGPRPDQIGVEVLGPRPDQIGIDKEAILGPRPDQIDAMDGPRPDQGAIDAIVGPRPDQIDAFVGPRPDQGAIDAMAGPRPDQIDAFVGPRPDQIEAIAGPRPDQIDAIAGPRPDQGALKAGSLIGRLRSGRIQSTGEAEAWQAEDALGERIAALETRIEGLTQRIKAADLRRLESLADKLDALVTLIERRS